MTQTLGPLFPEPPLWWQKLVQPTCDAVNLPMLSRHLHTVLGAAIFYHTVYIISTIISPRISRCYRKLDKRTKTNWDIHTVSQVQSAIILWLSYKVMNEDHVLAADKLHGYSPFGGDVYAAACGYFLWDVIISLYWVRWFGWGFVFHGVASLQVFAFSFRPFLMWWGPAFLAFEASTIFLNIHWWLDKLEMTGGWLQLINGGLLISTFFLVRGVWGWYAAFSVFHSLWKNRATVDNRLSLLYFASNTSLNLLNIFWFSQMIKAFKKRFPAADQKAKKAK
ncbi:hypothetical protein PYCC9005_001718 [Savitreella phatthalungensis]